MAHGVIPSHSSCRRGGLSRQQGILSPVHHMSSSTALHWGDFQGGNIRTVCSKTALIFLQLFLLAFQKSRSNQWNFNTPADNISFLQTYYPNVWVLPWKYKEQFVFCLGERYWSNSDFQLLQAGSHTRTSDIITDGKCLLLAQHASECFDHSASETGG